MTNLTLINAELQYPGRVGRVALASGHFGLASYDSAKFEGEPAAGSGLWSLRFGPSCTVQISPPIAKVAVVAEAFSQTFEVRMRYINIRQVAGPGAAC